MNSQLQGKIKTLPKEVYDFLTSAKSTELNILISGKYNLTLPQIKVFSDLIAQLFLKEIPVANLVDVIKQIFGFNELVARQMACDIAGTRLLVVMEWLGVDVAGLINSWGGSPSNYQNYTEIQRQAVIKEAEWLAKQLAEPVELVGELEDEDTDWGDREQKIRELFSANMVEVLSSDDDSSLIGVNEAIFHLILNVREEIKEELVGLLLNNQEILTSQRIVLDGKQVEASVGHWLAYFIAQQGSALFDTVALSDFITNSPNAKFLDYDEKRLLSNLLIVYRNLKFFPENLSSHDPKYWMIFPVSIPEEPLTKTAGAEEFIDLTQATSEVQTTTPKVFPKIDATLPEEISVSNQIAETEAMLAHYPEGSLERLALEEELNKLRQQQ